MKRCTVGLAVVFALWIFAAIVGLAPVKAVDSAVVLVYQRVGEAKQHPLESVTRAQFEAHLAQLKHDGFTVMKLRDIVAALTAKKALPERAVAITFDNAFRSVHREAWPRLQAAGFPFSVFVATDAVDAKDPDIMSWDELRTLADAGIAIESRGASNRPLWRLDEATQRSDIKKGRARVEAEIGNPPWHFAYPSGEQNATLRRSVRELGFDAAFVLRSGPVHAAEDRFALPRFELNERFAAPDRFQTIVAVLPLPIHDLVPKEAILTGNRPHIGFTIDRSAGPLDALACYVARQKRTEYTLSTAREITVELARAFVAGHDNRINCTLPGPDGRIRWLGLQYVVP